MIMPADDQAVPPSLTIETAAATPWDAIIVGAGPAGAAAAIALARTDWRVLLVDRATMPRPKVCGSCLSPRALGELRRLGASMPDGSRAGEMPLRRVRLVAAGRSVRLPLPPGGVLSREALDSRLVRMAVSAGAAWLPRTEAASVAEDDDPRHPLVVRFRPTAADPGLRPIRGRIVILAGGLTDHVRLPGEACTKRVQPGSRIGVGSVVAGRGLDLASGELVMAVGRSGYCGLVRLEDGSIDVAAAIDRHVLADAESVGEAVAGILDEADAGAHGIAIPRATLAGAAFRATPPLTHAAPLVAGSHRRIFRVGDAAGYVEPFTGEGMGWALSGSRLLATALLAAADPAAAYEQAHAACFRRLHGRCLRVAAALRQPWLVGAAIRAANAAPWAAKRIVPLLVGGRGETPS